MIPKGLTPDYAAPEVLNSFLDKFKKAPGNSRQVDGPAADMYSAGIILFQMLTGCTPFSTTSMDFTTIEVPKKVPQHLREIWQMAAAVTQQQTSWVSDGISH